MREKTQIIGRRLTREGEDSDMEKTHVREKTQKRNLCEDDGRDCSHSATLKKCLKPLEAKGEEEIPPEVNRIVTLQLF